MNKNKIFQSIFALIVFCGYVPQIFGHGFFGNTLVKTPVGYTEIQYLKENDSVISYDYKGHCVEGHIKHVVEASSPDMLLLVVNNSGELRVSPGHLFYDVASKTWIAAHELVARNVTLLKRCREGVKIDHAEHVSTHETGEEPFKLYDLEVDEYHNYCVSTEDVLVHNIAPAIAVGIAWIFGEGVVLEAGLAVAGVAAKVAYDATRPRELPDVNIGLGGPESMPYQRINHNQNEWSDDGSYARGWLSEKTEEPGEGWTLVAPKGLFFAGSEAEEYMSLYKEWMPAGADVLRMSVPSGGGQDPNDQNGGNNNNNNGQDPNGPKKPNGSGGNDGNGPKDSKLKDAIKDAAKIKAAEGMRKKLEEMQRAGSTINSESSNVKKQTLNELIKSKESTIEIRDEHIAKRNQYAADPYGNDNQGLLRKNPEHAPKIIDGRLKNLDMQINGQQKRIDQYDSEIQSRLQSGETPRESR